MDKTEPSDISAPLDTSTAQPENSARAVFESVSTPTSSTPTSKDREESLVPDTSATYSDAASWPGGAGADEATPSLDAPEHSPPFEALEHTTPKHGLPLDEPTDVGALEPTSEEIKAEAAVAYARPHRVLRFAMLGLVLLACAGLAVFAGHKPTVADPVSSIDSLYGHVSIPYDELPSPQLDAASTLPDIVTVNGELSIQGSLVLTPSAQPAAPLPGQLYFDQTSSELSYFNGKSFATVLTTDTLPPQQAGLSAGSGLSLSSGLLTNAGVLSLQGLSGNISLTAGPGMQIAGTTFSNSGVLSLGGLNGVVVLGNGLSVADGKLSGTGIQSLNTDGSLNITNDGQGNYTITGPMGVGNGNVSTVGGTTGHLAVFNNAQAISDSVISQSGTTVSVAGNLVVSSTISATSYSGDGASITNVNATQLGGQSSSYYTNASNVSSGTLNDARLSINVPLLSASDNFTGLLKHNGNAVCDASGNCVGVSGGSIGGGGTANKLALFTGTGFTVGNSLLSQDAGATTVTIAGDLTVTGGVSATSLSGSGSGVTNVNAAQLNGQAASYYTNASNLSTGTVSDSRLSTNVALKNGATNFTNTLQHNGNAVCDASGNCVGASGGAIGGGGTANLIALFTGSGFTVGNSLLSQDAGATTVSVSGNLSVSGSVSAASLSGNGSGLTNLNGSNVGSGTVGDARLSANVALLNGSNNFTGTLQHSGNNLCDTSGNCVGSGAGGALGGSGAANTIAMFNGSGYTVANSLLSQNAGATTVTATGNLVTTGNFTVGLSSNLSSKLGVVTSASTVGAIFQAASNQTADLLQNQDANGDILSGFSAGGAIYTNGTGNTFAGLTYPGTVTLGTVGTAGSTTYYYRVSAVNVQGETSASPEQNIATGASTLTTGNFNTVTFTAVAGASSFNIYRSISAGTELKIGSVTADGRIGTYVYNDQTNATGSGALPTGSGFNPVLKISQGNATGDVFDIFTNTSHTANGVATNTSLAVTSAGRIKSLTGLDLLNNQANTNSALTVQNASATTIAAYIQGAASQSADLFDFQDSSANVLSRFDSTGRLLVGSTGNNRAIVDTGLFSSSRSLTSDQALKIQVSGDAGNRFVISADGTQSWGSGSGSTDTNLYRSASGTLKTDGLFNTVSGYQINGTSGASVTCSGGQFLQNQVVAGGITTGGSCATPAAGVGIIGALDGGTANANAATISGTTLYLQSASATNPGLVNTVGQSFLGLKTFTSGVTVTGALTQSGGNFSLSGTGTSTLSAGGSLQQTAAGASYFTTTSGDMTIGTTSNTNAVIIKSTGTNGTVSIGDNTAVTITLGNTSDTTRTISIGNGNSSTSATVNLGSKGTVNIGATGATTYGNTTNINNTSNATGTQTVNIGSGANTANAVTIAAGSTGKINLTGNTALTGTLSGSSTINAVTGYQTNGTSGVSVACSGGQFLQDQVVSGGITTGGTCATTQIVTVGALDGGTANANAATLSGTTLYLQSASASFAGLINTGTQTFAGDKTFTGNIHIANVLLADATDITFTAPDTTTDPNVVFNMQCRTGCSSAQGRFAIQSNGTDAFSIGYNTTTASTVINVAAGVDVKLAGGSVGNAESAITHDFTCTSTEAVHDIVVITGTGAVGRTTTANSTAVAGVVVAKPSTTTCSIATSGEAQVWMSSNAANIGNSASTSTIGGAAQSQSIPSGGQSIGHFMSTKDGSNLAWVLLNGS